MNEPNRVLVVDDEEDIRESLREMLEFLGHHVETASNGHEALAKLESGFDLVLTDVVMPGIDGFEVVETIRKKYSVYDLPIIMVTGMSGRQDRLRAVEVGANDFISKPFDLTEIKARSSSLLQMKDAQDALKRHQVELESTVRQRTAALREALDEMVETQNQLRSAHLETIQRLVSAAEFKDRDTSNHIQRMSRYCALIANKLHLPPHEVELILHASPMHDIGKIGTPEEILLKPGKLNAEEWKLMRKHTLYGRQILRDSSSELLQAGEIIALTHHERWDGMGYPNGLAGDEIPVWGRICAVADVFDALTSERPYKRAFSNEEAVRLLVEGRGKQFDPQLVDIFVNNFDNVLDIQSTVALESLKV